MIELELKNRLTLFDYQEPIVTDIINNFHSNLPYVLGSSPSSGKTEMAIETIIRLLERNLVNKVLILAHSTNVLKENFYDRLLNYFDEHEVGIFKSGEEFNYDSKIQVMIPQNIKHIIGQFDLIIVDEAHHNVIVEEGNYVDIVQKVKPKFQLLLTGTPSKFIRENDISKVEGGNPLYKINAVGMDIIGFNRFHDVKFDLIRSSYTFKLQDYNSDDNLLKDSKFKFEDTKNTINNLIVGVVKNIALRHKLKLPENPDYISVAKNLINSGKFGKTLVICKNIRQANQVARILKKAFNTPIFVSESDSDADSKNLSDFKEREEGFLCVVNRAREGYDDKKVVNLIDITMTHNINLIYQMLCRVVRLDKNNPNPKMYIKVTSDTDEMAEYTMNIMTAALMLADTDNLMAFNGENFRNIIIPKIKQKKKNNGESEFRIPSEKGKSVKIDDIMALDLVKIFKEDKQKLISGNNRYAHTTLEESLNILKGVAYYTDKKGYFKLIRDNDIQASHEWGDKYKELESPDVGYKLHSVPWSLFNQSLKEFFDECYPDRKEYYTDKEGYFKLIRDSDIDHSGEWRDKYKELECPDSNYKIHSTPWRLFNQSQNEFFKECYPESRKETYQDKEGYFKLFRDNDIISGNVWCNKYKELECPDSNYKLHSMPWKLFKQSGNEFFDECYPNKKEYYKDKEGYFKLCRDNDINHSGEWMDSYKELECPDSNYKLHSIPYGIFNQSAKEFFDECYPERKEYYKDKEGYFKLCRDNNINHSGDWINGGCKELDCPDPNYKLKGHPWVIFNQSAKEFFDECYPDRKEFYKDKEGYFKLCRDNDITSSHGWFNKYKDLECPDLNYKLHSLPCSLFNQSSKDFYKECYPDRKESYQDKEGYFKLFRNNDITNGGVWKDMYKTLECPDPNCILILNIWRSFNQSVKEFFTEYRQWCIDNPKKYKPSHLGDFSKMNKTWSTSNSKTTHDRLKKDRTEWDTYHELYRKSREKWDEIPFMEISKKISKRPDLIIADFGCGENLLSKQITNKVHSFDHIAIDDNVTSCDVSNVPLSNDSVDVVVFSLSLMGSNYKDYLKEAHRVLRTYGSVFICEPLKKDNEPKLQELFDEIGFSCINGIRKTEKFIYIDAIKQYKE